MQLIRQDAGLHCGIPRHDPVGLFDAYRHHADAGHVAAVRDWADDRLQPRGAQRCVALAVLPDGCSDLRIAVSAWRFVALTCSENDDRVWPDPCKRFALRLIRDLRQLAVVGIRGAPGFGRRTFGGYWETPFDSPIR